MGDRNTNTLHDIREDVAGTLKRAAEPLGADLARAGRDAGDAARAVGGAIGRSSERVAHDLGDAAQKGRESLVSTTKRHPLASLATAAGVGALAALAVSLVGGQRRKHDS